MEIFNVGFGELFFILLIMLILLGPHEMTKAARSLGRFLRQVTRSPVWHDVVETSRQLRELPNKIIREANVEESLEEFEQVAGEIQGELQDGIQQINEETRSITAEARQLRAEASAPDSTGGEKESSPTIPGAPKGSVPAFKATSTGGEEDNCAQSSPDLK
ncbi:MAG: twin-arginine translocase TatA/TatE family subunit [Anaerolineaceae bacterium]|nr:twin-arginine translocase TatA/TatE family subunit [Anaerolineaceae bacterium]